ncbi:MAG: hypothetical protein P8X89_10325 [Reinekea sp.]
MKLINKIKKHYLIRKIKKTENKHPEINPINDRLKLLVINEKIDRKN